MSGKSANRGHPDYPVYIEKCKSIWERYGKKIADEEAKYAECRGRDSPASEMTKKLDRERNNELRLLQQEYSYLFTEE